MKAASFNQCGPTVSDYVNTINLTLIFKQVVTW